MELRQRPLPAALRTARPALGEIGAALGPEGEVVLVPGNHDHHLLTSWSERRAATREDADALGTETAVDWRSGEPLATVIDALAPARARVAYPGVWLSEDLYATHGHYADRHVTVPMLERLAAGVMARLTGEPAEGPRRAEDYEDVLVPVYAWIHALAQIGRPGLGRSEQGASAGARGVLVGEAPSRGRGGLRGSARRRALRTGFPVFVAALNRAGIGPLRRQLTGEELRRASLRAINEVLIRLQVPASTVIFGHTHRAGPLPTDKSAEWQTPRGQRLLNTGSWIDEPGFLGSEPARSPYRAGFAVRIDGSAAPELVNLLDPPA